MASNDILSQTKSELTQAYLDSMLGSKSPTVQAQELYGINASPNAMSISDPLSTISTNAKNTLISQGLDRDVANNIIQATLNESKGIAQDIINENQVNHLKEQYNLAQGVNAPQQVLDSILRQIPSNYSKQISDKPINKQVLPAQNNVTSSEASKQMQVELEKNTPYYVWGGETSNEILNPGMLEAKHADMKSKFDEYLRNEKRNNFSGVDFSDIEQIEELGDSKEKLSKYLTKRLYPFTNTDKLTEDQQKEFNETARFYQDYMDKTAQQGANEDNKLSNQEIALAILALQKNNNWGKGALPFWDKEGKLVGQGISIKGALTKWDGVRKNFADYQRYEKDYANAIAARDKLLNFSPTWQQVIRRDANDPTRIDIEKVYRAREDNLKRAINTYSASASMAHSHIIEKPSK